MPRFLEFAGDFMPKTRTIKAESARTKVEEAGIQRRRKEDA